MEGWLGDFSMVVARKEELFQGKRHVHQSGIETEDTCGPLL